MILFVIFGLGAFIVASTQAAVVEPLGSQDVLSAAERIGAWSPTAILALVVLASWVVVWKLYKDGQRDRIEAQKREDRMTEVLTRTTSVIATNTEVSRVCQARAGIPPPSGAPTV